MSASEIPPQTFSVLSERELEVLRLLASGHTTKSIAARLGRSEASINERLREARRKTGATSSRELARQIATQKIWDKNIDLPEPGSLTNSWGRHPVREHSWSKGAMFMLFSLSTAAAAGLVLSAASLNHQAEPAQPAQNSKISQSPLVGSWSLDVNRIPSEERPRRVTIAFEVSRDQVWTTEVEIVAPNGAISRAQSTAMLDGVPVPVSGNMGFIDTVSLRQPAPNTLVMTLGKNGSPVSTRVYTVAKDRKSMTETIIWPGDDVPKLETNYFNRNG